ncbi:hypothetical protein [Mesorhizobium sp. NPDC059025]|uniref:hypothetical protein n=1 Tax=unclassified Mesorhizobium TaxID=325217 RepID=UPI0036933D57
MGIVISESNSILTIAIEPQFEGFVPSAVVKFQIQFPASEIQTDNWIVTISGCDRFKFSEIRRAFLHTLYREKIYAETLPLRANLIAAVTSR